MGTTRRGLKYNPKDAGYQEAKKRGFVARSALKLEEIDRKHKLYRKSMKILDLGCAPGSWIQYASPKIGPAGRILGVDIAEVRVDVPNAKVVKADIFDLRVDKFPLETLAPFDLIQSDAMSKTTGIAESDCARSIALVEFAVHLARKGALKEGGSLIMKVFEGPGFTEFYVDLKRRFRKCSVNRPESIREGSREVYVVAHEFRGADLKGVDTEADVRDDQDTSDGSDD